MSMLSNMGSSAILRRLIFRSRATGLIRSRRYLSDCNSTGTRISLDSHESVAANRGVPWPMLPPFHKGGVVVYQFPSRIAEINLSRGKSEELPDDDAEIVGSSHGWAALFNRRNNDLFLSHPPSRRLIKLPPIDTLPDPLLNLDLDGHGSVSKLILSSSPDEEECRALMIFGPAKRLAFCLPGRSSEWTPIDDVLFIDDDIQPHVTFARVHEDLVYCSRRKVFTTITPCYLEFKLNCFRFTDERVIYKYISEIYEWDIQVPASAKKVRESCLLWQGSKEDEKGNTRMWLEENKEFLKEQCIQIPHLVYAHDDQLFLVLRFVMLMNPDDAASPLGYIPRCAVKGLTDVFPGKTFGFVVMKMDKMARKEFIGPILTPDCTSCTIVEDLNGMAMFVGVNHSFAIPSASCAQLKSNSIYFSDARGIRMMDSVNDNGIFDYESKTTSPLVF